jgi:hypothetical protein
MSNYRLYDSRETLLNGGDGLSAAAVGDFWRWAFGNLNEDTLKGIFAEWLVGRMLGLDMRLGARNGGANSDLILDDGTRIEVKSAAYWQSWKLYSEDGRPLRAEEIEARHWERLQKPLVFQVRRTRDSVDRSGATSRLWSDIYVFAAQYEKDPTSWNALDLNQWRFYSLLRGQVEQLPQTIPEHRLSLLCPPMAAADFAGRTWALIDQARTVRAQGEGLQPLGYP